MWIIALCIVVALVLFVIITCISEHLQVRGIQKQANAIETERIEAGIPFDDWYKSIIEVQSIE